MDESMKSASSAKSLPAILEDEKARVLVMEMMAGKIAELKPELDFASELGFSYPLAEQKLGVKGEELITILESLAGKGILIRNFFDRLLRCPQCQSVNLRPTTHCPKCGSGNIARGRVLEHFICGYIGLEDEFVAQGRYVCPKCRTELRTIGNDYQSMGLLRKCRDCAEIFNIVVIKWRCVTCSSLAAEDRVTEVNIYSYCFNEAKRDWLEFECKPKLHLMEFLRECGYEVEENAMAKGRSGAEHSLDILATSDDGIVTHRIAIDIEVGKEPVELSRVFDFDDRAYDVGIYNKVMIVAPGLSKEARTFASHQRIKVLMPGDLEKLLTNLSSRPVREAKEEEFEFKSRAQLIEYLKRRGYEVEENAMAKGRSGAEHNIGILATRDDGIVTQRIAIDIEEGGEPIELGRIFDFDDKAYDIGIQDKVFIVVSGLSPEARQFAERQRIRVFEVKELE